MSQQQPPLNLPDEGSISPQDATARIAKEQDLMILDVRVDDPEKPYTQFYPQAKRIPVTELEQRLDEIPQNQNLIIHCVRGGKAYNAYKTVCEKRPDITSVAFIKGEPEYK